MQFVVGFIFGITIAILAWRVGSLNTSGTLAAALTGGLIFGLGGLPWAALLLTFFITSSGLSRSFRNQKHLVSEKFSKGSQRDWGQVLANGGLGTALVILTALGLSESGFEGWSWIAYIGAMAAVNADTWATELGVLNPAPPRLITTGEKVEPGTSGAVSLYGTLASLAGSVLIGLIAAAFNSSDATLAIVTAAIFGGVVGSLIDSLLGASVQAIYYCPACDKMTERHPLHTCGTDTIHTRGWRWLNNDVVNFLASLIGAGLALGVWYLING
ncbi:MAG: DUF92 domain-containing protein [Anaerolineales bacterium]|jgi:uncharacterized protein (TIGR00297 family)